MRKYSLLLDIIKKEEEMQLTPTQITFLRLSVDDKLNALPTAHTIKNAIQLICLPNDDEIVTYDTQSESFE